MPTGYTSKIYDGEIVSGKEFILKCARAFRACIMLKDESLDSVIPEEFKPNTYYQEKLEETINNLRIYQNMTNSEVQKAIDDNYEKQIQEKKEHIERYKELRKRYEYTLTEVEKWIPPTDDHVNLKKFAIQQIKESIKYDCHEDFYKDEIVKPSIKEWIDSQIKYCLKDIDYYTKKIKEEFEEIETRNKWIKDLRDSL